MHAILGVNRTAHKRDPWRRFAHGPSFLLVSQHMLLLRSAGAITLLGLLGQMWAGCGSLEEDTPDRLEFTLPSATIVLSSASPQWRTPPSGSPMGVVCAGPLAATADCCSAVGGVDCARYPFVCDSVDNLCTLTFEIASGADVLLEPVAAVSAVRGRIFSRVDLDSLTITVTGAGSLPLRAASLYVGPQDSAGTDAPDVALLARFDPWLASSAPSPESSGLQAFSRFARDYQTPFSFLVSASVAVKAFVPASSLETFVLEGHATAFY
jgi:hypothetical protein